MYNQITLVGRLGSDPEMKYLETGKAVTTFNLATNHGYGERKTTIWFRVTFFDKQAETVNQYSRKGDMLLVSGTLSPLRPWRGSDGEPRCQPEVVGQTFRFLHSKRTEDSQENRNGQKPPTPQAEPAPTQAGAAQDEFDF